MKNRILASAMILVFLCSCNLIKPKHPDLSDETHQDFLQKIVKKKKSRPFIVTEFEVIKNSLNEADVLGVKVPYRDIRYNIKLKAEQDCYVYGKKTTFVDNIEECVRIQTTQDREYANTIPERVIKKDEVIEVKNYFVRYECTKDCSSDDDWTTNQLW